MPTTPDLTDEILRDGACSVNGAAEFAGVSTGTLWQAMAKSELEFFYCGTSRLIARSELRRWLREKYEKTRTTGRVT